MLVHGSVVGGRATWAAQRPLADRFELVVLERPGFPPNPPVERVDFEARRRARRRAPRAGDHLVGHSYGGVVALLAAARAAGARPLADGHRAAGDAGRARQPGGRRVRRTGRGAVRVWPRRTTRGVPPPVPRGRRLRARAARPAAARARAGRPGADGRARPVGGGRSRSTRSPPPPFPKLVVSGAPPPGVRRRSATSSRRDSGASASCSPGYGHTVQRHPEFNDGSPTSSTAPSPARRHQVARRASSCSRSRRRTRGFASLTISSRYTT